MCGIVGYIGTRNSQDVLLEGLSRLEYRGYDSAGIAVMTKQGLEIRKAEGRLENLAGRLEGEPLTGEVGIGHTRWATHGKPSDENSHPHTDVTMKFSVVHNGIIENYLELKEELTAEGVEFRSETDTEVISHLIAREYQGDVVKAVQQAIRHLRGAFALGVLTEYEPDRLVAVRCASPLVIGIGEGENFIGSDIPAILQYTRRVYILNDNEMAVLTKDAVDLMTIEGNSISREMIVVDWDALTAEKGGYDHFMLKEINEQPKAYRDTMRGRLREGLSGVKLTELKVITPEVLREIRNVHIVACGTAYHAGLVGRSLIEHNVNIPVETDVASEYRYRKPIIKPDTLVIVVSQSGETADTLAALREAKRCGASVLAITNVVGSSVAREADDTIVTWAGPEIAVASTKAYTSQLIAFMLFSLYWAEQVESLSQEEIRHQLAAIEALPEQVELILSQEDQLKRVAEDMAKHNSLFFIGRGVDYAVSLEGSLKLKEISYIHSEAYPAGELKHGTLALIEEGVPVIALVTQPALIEKMISNMQEVTARGGRIFAIVDQAHKEQVAKTADEVFVLPTTLAHLSPALSVVPTQLIAYYASLALGHDVDKPRNLAKSVTVE
ncbi:glutamine--fructose-6-phosphate transaminase (isomerizing) [Paenibacillus aquistagni]|uniref:Glutamine--fructose-6-phosphate aminotransferase [isomerizing] n=1 Tax=Paenibacillus aquistagni TaxID=1852522 RepID=A0A1X7LVA4_9BACL|nr:glutamine--fructose-6-phosphate transaminase (isomerizing) [Paenibacillus aquistagni]SMG57765.1 glucosamine--fructose-6-phosphate aminotransferase (isomerizing) [Paenibacillus aquistagni]